MTGPAKAVGLELEPGLAEADRARGERRRPRGAHDAGVLPLLSHALLATWQRREAGRLTLAGYRAAGGIQGAVAATAERAWSRSGPGGPDRRPGCCCCGWSGWARTPRPPAGAAPGGSWPRESADPGKTGGVAGGPGAGPAGDPGRGHRGDHPRGAAHRLAPAAALDRRGPRRPSAAPAGWRRTAGRGRTRAGTARCCTGGPGWSRPAAGPGRPGTPT
ncbi:hypothetical protein LT493_15785 [Streptomyces tricolor]|nr:hypothetical protein [Streptomyces tricolor]